MDWFSNIFKKKNTEENDSKGLYHFNNKKKNDYLECVICLKDMEYDEKLAMLPCSHIYHSKCILEWSKRKRKCPLCDSSF